MESSGERCQRGGEREGGERVQHPDRLVEEALAQPGGARAEAEEPSSRRQEAEEAVGGVGQC